MANTYGEYVAFSEEPTTERLKETMTELIRCIPDEHVVDMASLRFIYHKPKEAKDPFEFFDESEALKPLPIWTLAIRYEVKEADSTT